MGKFGEGGERGGHGVGWEIFRYSRTNTGVEGSGEEALAAIKQDVPPSTRYAYMHACACARQAGAVPVCVTQHVRPPGVCPRHICLHAPAPTDRVAGRCLPGVRAMPYFPSHLPGALNAPVTT